MKIKIILTSLDYLSLRLYILFLKKLSLKLNVKGSFFNFPKKKKRITLLKSPHVNKRALEQFEIKIYSTQILFSYNSFLFYFINQNKPKNVKLVISYSF